MKTVLCDNSLCAFPLRDDATPELIREYIDLLVKSGIKYIELDFRALMKARELPRGARYIFRMMDPMFLKLADFYDIDYVLLTYSDLKNEIKTDYPVMLELPLADKRTGASLKSYAESRIKGELAAVKISSSFEYAEPEEIRDIFNSLRTGFAPLIMNICPLNKYRTALDAALKFTYAGADLLTLTLGGTSKCCSLEDYVMTFMSVFGQLPRELDIHAMGRASIIASRLFRSGESQLPDILDLLDCDIRLLKNADTGEKVDMRVGIKDSEFLNREYKTALQKMAEFERIPEDLFEYMNRAVKHFDKGFFNEELMYRKRRGPLN